MGKRKGTKYEHNHTYNAAARESEDRKMNRLRGMEVKRLRNNLEKQIQNMQRYIPPEKRKKQIITSNAMISRVAAPGVALRPALRACGKPLAFS